MAKWQNGKMAKIQRTGTNDTQTKMQSGARSQPDRSAAGVCDVASRTGWESRKNSEAKEKKSCKRDARKHVGCTHVRGCGLNTYFLMVILSRLCMSGLPGQSASSRSFSFFPSFLPSFLFASLSSLRFLAPFSWCFASSISLSSPVFSFPLASFVSASLRSSRGRAAVRKVFSWRLVVFPGADHRETAERNQSSGWAD